MPVLQLLAFIVGLLVFIPTWTAVTHLAFEKYVPHKASGVLLERFGKYWVSCFCCLVSLGYWDIYTNE